VASKLREIIECLWTNEGISLNVGYSSESEGNYLNKYNANLLDSEGMTDYLQLMVRRTGTNSALRFEKAEEDARNILNKIRENFEVSGQNEIPMGDSGNYFEYVINFRVFEGG